MCWNITGSPPPAALKKLVPKNLSVSSMVTAPASTGITAISRNAVISQLHTNSGIFSRSMPGARRLRMVAMMLIAPMIELMPIRWMAKIMKAHRVAALRATSGGYIVQPPAGAPPGMNRVDSSSMKANGRIQNDQLFMRGSAMSGAPTISGIIQLAEADEGRHHRAEDHHQRVHRGHFVEEIRLHELQAGLEQLGADDHRHRRRR